MDTLRIGYVNAMGLDLKTHEVCNSFIHSSHFDILCVSETWFSNRPTYLSNSFLFAESLFPENPHLNRRQDGGLLILINPQLRSNFSLSYRSRYSLVIRHEMSETTLAFSYFPPSLSDTDITTELAKIGPSNALIGDLNIRLGSQSGDTVTSSQARRTVFSRYITNNSLSYVRNANHAVTSRTDHIYSNLESLSWEYIRTLNFQTDHGLMQIDIDLPVSSQRNPSNLGSYRFNFKPLQNPVFKQEFVSTFDELHASSLLLQCESALQFCCHSMILPSTSDAQDIIDTTYSLLIDTITEHLTNHLTTYDAHEVKSKPDPILQNSSEAPTSVLRTVRLFKRSQRTLAAKSPIISEDPNKSPLEECSHYYSNQYQSDELIPKIERQNDIDFGFSFTNSAIRHQIKKYSLTKAMGPDGIHTIVFKALVESDNFVQCLSALFQLYASTGLVPTQWSQCNLHLLIKKKNQPATASNTRPIALSSILRRIFERLLMRAWQKQMLDANINTSWMELNPGQAGFRRGYSTISHLILSDELSRHECPFSVFLDLKGAFDSVSWNQLDILLRKRNCPPTQRNLILSLICRPAELLLSVNQSERVPISTRKGVFQGGGISAFIFAIYIDPLANDLNQHTPPHRPLALLYADDVQLKPRSVTEAQSALNKCSQYAIEYKMNWSIPKCAIVGNCKIDLLLSDSCLPRAEEYTYLGATHRSNGVDWRSTYAKNTTKQTRLLTALSDRNWHPRTRLIIYRTFIRPINEYTAVLTWIWAQKDLSKRSDLLKQMEISHQGAIKWIFNRRRHLKLMDYMSGLGPWDHRFECLKAGLVFCLKNMHESNPLRATRAFYMVSTSKNYILQDCFKSAYASAYSKDNENHKLSWFTWKKRKLKILQNASSEHSATISYYFPVVNLDGSSPIFLLDWKDFDLTLNWRSNNALLNRTCTCSQNFNRAHLGCILNGNLLFDSILKDRSYKTSSRKVLTQSGSKYHLTVLDHLLNRRQYADFIALFEHISSTLDLLPPSEL